MAETQTPFYLVGVGASAGGLEALQQFFSQASALSTPTEEPVGLPPLTQPKPTNLLSTVTAVDATTPSRTSRAAASSNPVESAAISSTAADKRGEQKSVATSVAQHERQIAVSPHQALLEQIAFVVVQHLSPDYESHMVDLLAKQTSLPVLEAIDGCQVKPGHIYLIPRRKNMTIYHGRLLLVDIDRSHGLNLPIDIFLESLAIEQREKAIGIILSGTGSDGTRGIQLIKDAGGLVMAQDHTAKFDGMPRSAILTQLVDRIASPPELFHSVLNYVRHQGNSLDYRMSFISQATDMDKLFAALRARTEIDFSDYKPNTISRRLERRMSLHQIDNLADYVRYLSHAEHEAENLVKEFLIGVTRFFRDPEAFDLLAAEVIPALVTAKPMHEPIRVWTPGCATGEEAYTLAILFQEYMSQHNQFRDVKIFATDIDTDALNVAGRGCYPPASVADIAPERLTTFFSPTEDGFEIHRHLRNMVVFARQNIIKDPPFAKIDLVVCRNMLIYLKPVLQQQVLSTFRFALRHTGFLFLGSSESLGEAADGFVPISTKWKIYRHEGAAQQRLPLAVNAYAFSQPNPKSAHVATVSGEQLRQDRLLRTLIEQLIPQILPPSVIVDEQGTILHGFGDIRTVLEVPVGVGLTLTLQHMVPDPLRAPIVTALHRTFTKGEDVHYRNIVLANGDAVRMVHLSTRLLNASNKQNQFVLVSFEPVVADSLYAQSARGNIDSDALAHVADLEQELLDTRGNLQDTIEALETANEELQATNEELLAANEELQSTNEELQSVNEELVTVNSEYQMRIREMSQLNDDINNLLDATPVGIILLDETLAIRKFTPAARQFLNLLAQDIGRPLGHLSHELLEIDLVGLARKVLQTGSVQSIEARTKTGGGCLLALLPYLTHNAHVAGVVITIVDLSEQMKIRGRLASEQVKTNSAIEAGGLATWEMFLETGAVSFSPRKAELLGYHPQEFNHYTDFTALIHPDDYEFVMAAMVQHLHNQTAMYQAEYRIRANNGGYRWYKDVGKITRRTQDGSPLIVAGITADTTVHKEMVEQITTLQKENALLKEELAIYNGSGDTNCGSPDRT